MAGACLHPDVIYRHLFEVACVTWHRRMQRACPACMRSPTHVFFDAFVFDPFFDSARTTMTLALCSSSSFTMTVCAGIVYLIGGCVCGEILGALTACAVLAIIGRSVQQPGMRSCLSTTV